MHLDNCTAKKNEKSKASCKRGLRKERAQVRKKQLVSGRSDEKIKLIRAQGGCQGTIRRRRTWQAAKSYGEPQAGREP